jgi:NAD+ synthase (glutamine-hydrolysing)
MLCPKYNKINKMNKLVSPFKSLVLPILVGGFGMLSQPTSRCDAGQGQKIPPNLSFNFSSDKSGPDPEIRVNLDIGFKFPDKKTIQKGRKNYEELTGFKNDLKGLIAKSNSSINPEDLKAIIEKWEDKTANILKVSDAPITEAPKQYRKIIDDTLKKMAEKKNSSESTDSAIPRKVVKDLLPELQEELDKQRSKIIFNPSKWLDEKVSKIADYYKKHGLKAVVISVSGGVDSAVVSGISAKVRDLVNKDPTHPLNEANGGKFILIAQPINSTPEIQNRAYEVGKKFNFEVITIDQSENWKNICDQVNINYKSPLSPFAASMLKSYMRTPVAYAFAASLRGIVWGTGNFDEDGILRYFCKFGDGAIDLSIIHDLHKSQVFELAKYLGVPNSILIAPPSADLAPGQTDETELGIKYDLVFLIVNFLFGYTKTEKDNFVNSLSPEARDQFSDGVKRVLQLEKSTRHKKSLDPIKIELDECHSVYSNMIKDNVDIDGFSEYGRGWK